MKYEEHVWGGVVIKVVVQFYILNVKLRV